MRAMGKRSVSSALLVWVNLAWFFLAFVLVVATAVVVFGFISGTNILAVQIDANGSPNVDVGRDAQMAIPVALSVESRAMHVAAPALDIQNAELRDIQASLRFAPRTGAFFAANVTMVIGLLGLGLWMLAQLRGLFGALRDGQPFASDNATRVRRIAWTVILAECLRAGVVFFEHSYAMSYFVAEGLHFVARPHLNLFAIINGLIIMVISEVFRAGSRLDEDQSLTV